MACAILGVLFLFSVGFLALIAYPILVAPVCDDPVRCVRGRVTYWLMLAGYFAGGFPPLMMYAELSPGYAFIGLVLGAVLGNLIGRVVAHDMKPEVEEDRV